VKPKENKINKVLSVSNKSPANSNNDSDSRGSREQFPKDQLNGKRRNSLGSLKPDHTDQETTRDNSSINNFLPSFMQTTQSPKAKIKYEIHVIFR